MDMAASLKKAVKKALPDAVIVIDRYHIQRMANQALNKVRNRLRREVQRKSNERTMCKSSLLRKHPNKLKEGERAELEMWFSVKPELRAAYELKEQFFAIWHTHSKAAAQESYRQWLLCIPPELRKDFGKILTEMKKWGKYVFNYFDYRYTNAFTESTNRRVKDIQREARSGSFETVRAKVIYGTIVRQQMKAARERQAKPKRSRSGKAGGVLVPETLLPLMRQTSIQMSLF
jgi:transposase